MTKRNILRITLQVNIIIRNGRLLPFIMENGELFGEWKFFIKAVDIKYICVEIF